MSGTPEHRLMPRGRHDVARLLAFLGLHAVPGVESWDGTWWTSSASLPGGPAVVQVRAAGSAGQRAVVVRLCLSEPGDEGTALQRVRHLLDLDSEVARAERRLAADDGLAPLLARRPGLRVPGTLDAWETLVRTIVGQQISVAGARSVTARLVSAAGTPLSVGLRSQAPTVSHTFPSPRAVLEADDDALAMPRARALAIRGSADLFASTRGVPSREALLALPGIGAWTADYLQLRAHRDPDVFLPGDLAVRRAIERSHGPSTPRAVSALADGWRPHRSLALMHLWAEYLGL